MLGHPVSKIRTFRTVVNQTIVVHKALNEKCLLNHAGQNWMFWGSPVQQSRNNCCRKCIVAGELKPNSERRETT